MRSIVRQINVSDPIVATKISNNGQISRPVTEIAPNTETIYLSFHLEMPEGASDIPLTFNWLVNGQLMYSFSESHTRGQVIVQLDRKRLGLSEFPRGDSAIEV